MISNYLGFFLTFDVKILNVTVLFLVGVISKCQHAPNCYTLGILQMKSGTVDSFQFKKNNPVDRIILNVKAYISIFFLNSTSHKQILHRFISS